MFEAAFAGRARGQWRSLSDAERAVVLRLIAEIEAQPFVDGMRRVSYLMPPLVFTAYTAAGWRIVYRVVDNRFVEIFSIDWIGLAP